MPNALATIGDSLKALTPTVVTKLPFANFGNGSNRFSSSPVWLGDLVERGYVSNNGEYDFGKLCGDPLHNSVIASCVLAYAKALSEAPYILQHREPDGKWKDVHDHDALDLLHRPNKELDPFDLSYSTVGHKIARGACRWLIVMNSTKTKPTEIWPWDPRKAIPRGTKDDFISHYEVTPENGEMILWDERYVINFRYMPNLYNLRDGWTPVATGERQIVGFRSAVEFETAILLNAGVISLLVAIKQSQANGAPINVTPEQFNAFLDTMKRQLMGNKQSAGGIFGVSLPLEIQKMAYSPSEMSIDGMFSIFERHLCALCDCDPAITRWGGGTAAIPYSNLETIIRDFWLRSLIPMIRRDDATLTRQWLPLWFGGSELKNWRVWRDYSDVRALQENQSEIHNMHRSDYDSGGIDLYTFQTNIGIQNPPDEYKQMFAKAPMKFGEQPAPAPTGAPQQSENEPEKEEGGEEE